MGKPVSSRKNIYIKNKSIREWLSHQDNASAEIERALLEMIENDPREQRERILALIQMTKEDHAEIKRLLVEKK